MASVNDLKNRANKIIGAFLPESVTNEEVGKLLLDIINYFNEYVNSIPGASEIIGDYWSKKELEYIDGYLYALGAKIRAGESDNSEKWFGYSFPDWLDQRVRTTDEVKFKRVTAEEFIENIEDLTPEGQSLVLSGKAASYLLNETGGETPGPGATTIGELANVSPEADSAPDGSLLVMDGGMFTHKSPVLTAINELTGLLIPVYDSLRKRFIWIDAQNIGSITPSGNDVFPYVLPFKLA